MPPFLTRDLCRIRIPADVECEPLAADFTRIRSPRVNSSGVTPPLDGVIIGQVRASGTLIDLDYEALLHELTLLARAVGAGDDAEDVAQETLLNARDKLSQLRADDRLRPWLRQSAVRRVLAYRRRARRWVRGDDLVFAPGDVSLGLDIRAAIAHLPRRERQLLALVYGLGYSQQEAGDALGIARGTVASALFRARRTLAGVLIDYWTHGGT